MLKYNCINIIITTNNTNKDFVKLFNSGKPLFETPPKSFANCYIIHDKYLHIDFLLKIKELQSNKEIKELLSNKAIEEKIEN